MKKFYIIFFILSFFTRILFSADEQQATPPNEQTKASTEKTETKEPTKPSTDKEEDKKTSKKEKKEPDSPTSENTTPSETSAQTNVEFEQRTWEKSEAIELEKDDTLPLIKNEKIKNIVDQAKEITQNIQTTSEGILKKREEAYSNYAKADTQLDKFLQEINMEVGKFQVKIKQAEEQANTTLQTNQKVELELYKRDWEQVKTDVEKLDKTENQLLEELKKLDNKVDEALEISVNTRRLKLELLKTTNEQDATTKLDQIKDFQQKLNILQNSISSEYSNRIDSLAKQIETDLQSLQERSSKLQEKAKELKLVEEQSHENETLNSKKNDPKKTDPKKGFFYTKTVSATAWVINGCAKIINWFKNLFSKKENIPTESTQIQQKTEQTAEIEELKSKIKEQEETIKKLTDLPPTATQAASPTPQTEETPGIKQKIKYALWKFLDFIEWCFEKIKLASTRLYEKYAKEKITTFATDIQNKIKELQTQEKPAETQQNQLTNSPAEQFSSKSSEENINNKKENAEAAEMGPAGKTQEASGGTPPIQ